MRASMQHVVEHFFTALLVLASALIVWFAGYVVYRLFKE